MQLNEFTPAQVRAIIANLHKLPHKEQQETLTLLEELTERKTANAAKDSLLAFANKMAPVLQIETEPKVFMVGPHHRQLAKLMDAVARGEKHRILISVAPRFGKSLMSSYLFPAWYLGKFPNRRVIMASHTSDLATDFGRKVRDLIAEPTYQEVFPGVSLRADIKAAGKWATNMGGEYFAVGVGGALAGRGANLCIAPTTRINTHNGATCADDINPGDWVQSHSGYVRVTHRVDSWHSATIEINKRLKISAQHPVWIYGQGWVHAEYIKCGQLLWTTSIWSIIGSSIRRLCYGQAIQDPWADRDTRVQYLGNDETAMHKPPSGELHFVRSAWDYGVQLVATVREFFSGHGPSPRGTHLGSDRLGAWLQPSELSLGYYRTAEQQQAQLRAGDCVWSDQDVGTVGPAFGYDNRYCSSPGSHHADAPGRSIQQTQDVPCEADHYTAQLGRGRSAAARVLSWCSENIGVFRSAEKSIVGSYAAKIAGILCGLLLGVRWVTTLERTEHTPKRFIDFTVTGDHTFVADTYLTHNCIIDDPFSEQTVMAGNTDVFDDAWTWFQTGPLQRLAPDGACIVIHTRWSKNDLIGRLQNQMATNPEADQWDVIEFPAVLHVDTPQAKSLWPERWSLEALLKKKANMAPQFWQAQYMQSPTSEAGALIKREWWKDWEKEDPPDCDYVIICLDAAQEAHTRADFNAFQAWGVFYDDKERANIIILDAWKKRMEFPELKKAMYAEYERWEPDTCLIEKKSSGSVLFQEMRAAGIPVSEFTPGKGQDKIARVNSVSDIFSSGLVWAPKSRRWAMEVIEECSDFPNGEYDDQVDAMTLALRRFRTGGFIKLDMDEQDEADAYKRKRKYY